ncbi:MAG: hypothetical protein [Caudoviricetes sp.]|nr:MAG: hypothetical protein [Caudoviricetes sp.]
MANPYHIKIELPSEANQSAMAETQTGSLGGESSGANLSSDIALKAARNLVSFAAVKSTADNIISYKISQVSLETGANEYEQRLATVHSIVSQSIGAGVTLAMGAATGPVGFTIAAIGVVSSAISKLVSINQKEEALRTQQGLEDVSISMQSIRAGTAGRRGVNQ